MTLLSSIRPPRKWKYGVKMTCDLFGELPEERWHFIRAVDPEHAKKQIGERFAGSNPHFEYKESVEYEVHRADHDICFYCGKEYHPMAVWIYQGITFSVCTLEFIYEGDQFMDIKEYFVCSEKAIADGFISRPDLTPKR